MTQQEQAEQKLKDMLTAVGLPVKGSYRTAEVCLVMGFSRATFCRLIDSYEPDADGNPTVAYSLDSYTLRQERRVRYPELVAFLFRNNTYQRKYGTDPNQMDLFAANE